ncbi:ABC transporter substrate-binding protein [Bifidobacterium catulorum]|uniref:Glycine/betaine ABC transporter n=1 Tax=Bifidobacterium catulorum TaxID=1630173 RepID=A0A2U2MSS4_9BIFI|nr:ABC transporter substrate-binding protein [Bifidobacterium catulorum]PWG59899.1 glycine/betaine ABC transporter [Bifidobacterium catulorum]
MALSSRIISVVAAATVAALTLSGCGSSDPFGSSASSDGGGSSIVVGSANFSESEIIARIYARALNDEGIRASVKANIGSREVYMKALEDGSIDMVPDYSGNLLQYYDADSTAVSENDVYKALGKALPDGVGVLDKAAAQDADSFYVTKKTSEDKGVRSLADLGRLGSHVKIAAPPEFAGRAYGPDGLKKHYGVDVTLVPVNDGGGAATVKALTDGSVQFVRLDSTSPLIAANDLVRLDDPEQLILAQNVVPVIASDRVNDKARAVIDRVQSALTTDDLMEMNARSANDKESAQRVAVDWLKKAR